MNFLDKKIKVECKYCGAIQEVYEPEYTSSIKGVWKTLYWICWNCKKACYKNINKNELILWN